MSWITSNNAPLLGAQAVVDVSGLPDGFRDGQKLRQEYEARQQQKALNEIMKVGDHNGRLELAQQHKYAGALVPQLQKYEEDRQKAALDNLKTSADIGKVYGETGKLGAETGEIGVKTQGQTIKNMTDKYSQISAGALTQNPQYFALMLGDFQNAGLINPDQKGAIIDMMMKDPENAAKVMQQLARGTIEGFKATAPEVTYTNLGDRVESQVYDPLANTVTGKGGYNIGQSPDNKATNATSRANNINTVEGQKYASDNTYEASVYGTDVRAKTASEAQAIDWFEKTEKAKDNEFKRENPQANRKQIPPSAMKTMGELQDKLASNATTMTENLKWMKRLNSGELQLGAMKNFGNTAAARTGITSLGENPEAYAEFNAYLKDLANKALRLNAGVQTDMDYKRQLEAIVAGTSIPKDNGIAFGLLNRIHRDFDSQNRAIYKTASDYDREYRGVVRPAYGQGRKKPSTNKQPAKETAGQSIIGSTLGGR